MSMQLLIYAYENIQLYKIIHMLTFVLLTQLNIYISSKATMIIQVTVIQSLNYGFFYVLVQCVYCIFYTL